MNRFDFSPLRYCRMWSGLTAFPVEFCAGAIPKTIAKQQMNRTTASDRKCTTRGGSAPGDALQQFAQIADPVVRLPARQFRLLAVAVTHRAGFHARPAAGLHIRR